MDTRIDRLRAVMTDQSVDALLVTSETNVRYLAGFTGDSSYLLISSERVAILSDRRYEEQIAAECPNLESFIRGPERQMPDVLRDAIGSFDCRRVGLEAMDVSWAAVEGFRDAVSDIEFVGTSNLVEQLRQIKEAGEIDIIRRAIRIAEQAFAAIRATLRIGQTELEIAYQLEHWIRHFGGEGTGFDTIVAVGPNAALPHAQPGDRRIGEDPALLIDWGAKYQGYTSDMTRMTAINACSNEMREIYPIVLEAQLAAIDAIGPGVDLRVVDAAARDVITQAGYGGQFGHGLGHGIGLQVHESPRISTISEGVLEPGMIVTVEPGIYLPGKLGVRIEDDVLVTSNGHEVLSTASKGLDDCVVML